jgi:hypothetical protein
MRDPQTPEEWQEAVDAAAGMRALADCKMYGVIEGGPDINIARCDELLECGRKRGVYPSRPVVDLAVEVAAAFNRERKE